MPEQIQISNREVKTALPVDTTEMPIRKVDWKRIYRKVHGIPRHTLLYTTISATSWGIGTSALLSLIPLYQATQNLEAWVKPTYWAVGIACCVVGAITRHFAKDKEKHIESSCEEVMRDMEDVNKIYFPDEKL